jgi:hypothetical protein
VEDRGEEVRFSEKSVNLTGVYGFTSRGYWREHADIIYVEFFKKTPCGL